MSNLKKTIQINPELFKIQSSTKSRTKNNREKSKKTITPSFLKKQLIDRIKSHKNKVESSLEQPSREKEKEKEKESIQTNNNNKDDDEFILSMNFLSTLSEEKKSTPTKTTFIDNITLSNPNPVHIDLPIELLENNNVLNEIPSNEILSNKIPSNEIPSNKILSNDISLDEFPSNETRVDEIPIKQSIKYTHPNDVPYGCLKNGNKPTYRSWMNK